MVNQRNMRFIQILTVISLVVALQVRQEASQNPSAEVGRVVGYVLDQTGTGLPGVEVTLTGRDVPPRQVVSDRDGRFTFDGVTPASAYAIRGTLTGFAPEEQHDVTVTAGQTQVINLELEVRCVKEPVIVTGSFSDLERISDADAIAYVRMGDAGEDLEDGCGPRREAAILKKVPFSKAGQGLGATVRVLGASRFERGKEYLVALHSYGKKHPRIDVEFMREVVGGRIRGESAVLDIHDGMRVEDALKRLQEIRERQSR